MDRGPSARVRAARSRNEAGRRPAAFCRTPRSRRRGGGRGRVGRTCGVMVSDRRAGKERRALFRASNKAETKTTRRGSPIRRLIFASVALSPRWRHRPSAPKPRALARRDAEASRPRARKPRETAQRTTLRGKSREVSLEARDARAARFTARAIAASRRRSAGTQSRTNRRPTDRRRTKEKPGWSHWRKDRGADPHSPAGFFHRARDSPRRGPKPVTRLLGNTP